MNSECHIHSATVIDNFRCRNSGKSEIIGLHCMERSDIASVHYYYIRAVMRLSAGSHCRILSFVRKTIFAIKNDSWDTGIYSMCREYRDLLGLSRSFCSLMIGSRDTRLYSHAIYAIFYIYFK